MLDRLRIVVLQDIAVLMHKKDSIVCLVYPFLNPKNFLSFQAEVINQVKLAQNPIDISIERVLPGLCGHIHNMHDDVRSQCTINNKMDGLVQPQHLQSFIDHVSVFQFSSSSSKSSTTNVQPQKK